MPFTFGNLTHSYILALLAELGDKTWVLTCICAVWCPWNGLRERTPKLLKIECLLVLMGAAFALTLRTVLIAFGVDPFYWDGFCNTAATIILFVCACRATWEWRCAIRDYQVARSEGVSSGAKGLGSTDPNAAITDAVDPEKEGYGSMTGTFEINYNRTTFDWFVLLSLAFLFPAFSIVCAEAMDRSQGVLVQVDHQRADLALGAPLGFFTASCMAVLFGYVVQKCFEDLRWMLLVVSSVLWILMLCCFRDALLRLCMGDMKLFPTSIDG